MYRFSTLLILISLTLTAWADTEHKQSGTQASGSWTNPTDAIDDDDTRATHANGDGIDTIYLDNHGFTITAGATVDSIILYTQLQGSASQAGRRDVSAQLTVDGTTGVGDVISDIRGGNGADADITSRGSTDALWGYGFDADSINASGFGVILWNEVTQAGNIGIDSVSIEVHYTPAASGPDPQMIIIQGTQ